MAKQRRNLIKVASRVLTESKEDSYQPTTRELKERFSLNEVQVKMVKDHVKRAADIEGLYWAYDPGQGSFRIAPVNAPHIFHRMKRFEYDRAAKQLQRLSYGLQFGVSENYVTESSVVTVHKRNRKLARDVRSTFDQLEFTVSPDSTE